MLFYDFEVFLLDWLVVIIDVSEKKVHVIVNSPEELEEFYKAKQNDIWCGFNSRHYDQYILKGIRADAAEPKSIDRLYNLGLSHIRKARKGKDSINNGIDLIQNYHIIIHPKCVNFITEISNYTWDTDTKTGKKLNEPVDDFNHLMDAMRYAMEDFGKASAFSFD